MVEQRVAAREQGAVGLDLRKAEHQLDRLDAVHAQAPALDDTFRAKLRQRPHGTGARDLELREPSVAMKVLRDVVDPGEVDPVDAHAFQAVLDRALRTVGRVVVDDFVLAAVLEGRACPSRRSPAVPSRPHRGMIRPTLVLST